MLVVCLCLHYNTNGGAMSGPWPSLWFMALASWFMSLTPSLVTNTFYWSVCVLCCVVSDRTGNVNTDKWLTAGRTRPHPLGLLDPAHLLSVLKSALLASLVDWRWQIRTVKLVRTQLISTRQSHYRNMLPCPARCLTWLINCLEYFEKAVKNC